MKFNGWYDEESNEFDVFVDGEPLPLYLEYVNHSPTGHSWGYHGSGPAQLAFALLFHVTKDKQLALESYQLFKSDVVARLHGDWSLSEDFIRNWIDE